MKIHFLLLILILIIYAYFNCINYFKCYIIGHVEYALVKLRFKFEKLNLTYNNLNYKLYYNELLLKMPNRDNPDYKIYNNGSQWKEVCNDEITWKLKFYLITFYSQNILTHTFFTTLAKKNKNYVLKNRKIIIAKIKRYFNYILKFKNNGIKPIIFKLINSNTQTATNYNPYKLNVSKLQETYFVFFPKYYIIFKNTIDIQTMEITKNIKRSYYLAPFLNLYIFKALIIFY
jgi:hypothetical protein